jgi:CheY-like chemotaxis protein
MYQAAPQSTGTPRSPGAGAGGRLVRPDGTALRILIVEDDLVIRLDLEDVLSRHGGDVVSSTRKGMDAITLVERFQPDAVLMDIRIDGEIDGIETARMIRRRFGTPVVFLSGHGDMQTRARIAELKGPELLTKPATSTELVRAVRRACGL